MTQSQWTNEDVVFQQMLSRLLGECRQAMAARGPLALPGEDDKAKRDAIDVVDCILAGLQGKHWVRAHRIKAMVEDATGRKKLSPRVRGAR